MQRETAQFVNQKFNHIRAMGFIFEQSRTVFQLLSLLGRERDDAFSRLA